MADERSTSRDILPLPEQADLLPRGPDLTLGDFSGPLDLLFYLIEKNEIDLFDIPIASLTSQYLTYLEGVTDLDMDVASDFLVMGSSLVQLKSQMMLPKPPADIESQDPRDELVLRLLAYRRCKLIASELRRREEIYSGVVFRVPENPAHLGLKPPDPEALWADETDFSQVRFRQARAALVERNQARFQDLSEKMDYIVSREHISIKEWIDKLWQALLEEPEVHFDRMFPAAAGRSKRLTGFLAVLELLKQNKVSAKQTKPFADLIITRREEESHE